MLNNFVSFAAAAAAGDAQGGTGMSIGFIVLYIVFFAGLVYFMFLKPQKKQAAQQDEMMKNLKVGDTIMTTSGFYGTVIGIDDDTVIVEFGNNKNCRIPMHKKAIAEVESSEAAYEEAEDAETSEEQEKTSLFGKKKK